MPKITTIYSVSYGHSSTVLTGNEVVANCAQKKTRMKTQHCWLCTNHLDIEVVKNKEFLSAPGNTLWRAKSNKSSSCLNVISNATKCSGNECTHCRNITHLIMYWSSWFSTTLSSYIVVLERCLASGHGACDKLIVVDWRSSIAGCEVLAGQLRLMPPTVYYKRQLKQLLLN